MSDFVVVVTFGGREEYISTYEDLEKFCEKLRGELEKECEYHSWYIRIPPDRLLALLKKAYVKAASVSEVISEFLEENNLAKSLARTITPTLSSLGLRSSERFTQQAIEIGKLLSEGKLEEVKSKLYKLILKNCVLREILEKMNCAEVEKAVAAVLTAYGKSVRFDELKYTAELLRMVSPKCGDCDFRCISPEKLETCRDKLVQTSKTYLRELFEKLDIALLPEHLDFARRGENYAIIVKGTARQIGVVLLSSPLESGELQQIKTALSKLDAAVREGEFEVYVKIIPILETGEKCRSIKLLIEVIRGDLERVSKFVKL